MQLRERHAGHKSRREGGRDARVGKGGKGGGGRKGKSRGREEAERQRQRAEWVGLGQHSQYCLGGGVTSYLTGMCQVAIADGWLAQFGGKRMLMLLVAAGCPGLKGLVVGCGGLLGPRPG